jgi:cell division transport system permease protein
MAKDERASIGLTKIWSEGEGVERVSLPALASHIVRRAYENITRSPVTATLTVVTIGVALFLLGVFILLVHNCSIAVSKESGEVMINVFLQDSVTADMAQTFRGELEGMSPGVEVRYTDKAQALSNFRGMLGDEAVILEGLEKENPLPASLDIIVSEPERAEDLYTAMAKKLTGDSRVDSVRYSRGAAHQLKRMLSVIEVGGAIGVVFLLVITGFIIANTIKLALYSHRVEVEIMELVGASRRAIFAPYMLEGLLQGITGAVCGIVLVFAVYLFMKDALVKTDLLQFIFPQFTFLPITAVLSICLAGAVVGMSGSFLAVRRFLSEG